MAVVLVMRKVFYPHNQSCVVDAKKDTHLIGINVTKMNPIVTKVNIILLKNRPICYSIVRKLKLIYVSGLPFRLLFMWIIESTCRLYIMFYRFYPTRNYLRFKMWIWLIFRNFRILLGWFQMPPLPLILSNLLRNNKQRLYILRQRILE